MRNGSKRIVLNVDGMARGFRAGARANYGRLGTLLVSIALMCCGCGATEGGAFDSDQSDTQTNAADQSGPTPDQLSGDTTTDSATPDTNTVDTNVSDTVSPADGTANTDMPDLDEVPDLVDGPPPESMDDEPIQKAESFEEIELATTGKQVVFVNFDGVTISDCENYCSDATRNSSWAIGEHFGESSKSFAAFGGSQASRDTIVSTMRQAFADYNIEFVTTRPAQGAYTMLIISPSGGPNHGVAPLNCQNTNASDIAFVYRIGSSSNRWIAQAGAHELGHSFGLAHVKSSSAIMQWASSGSQFLTSEYDTGHPSGKCFEGSTQDARSMLLEVLGPAGGPEPESFNGTFADDDGGVFEDAIEAIVAEGITVGCTGGERPEYCPTRVVTRGQMVVFMQRALNLPKSSKDWFPDDNGAWFEAAANSAADAGITTGFQDGTFGGEIAINRGQMAAFLDRGFNLPETSTDYFDDDNGGIYEPYINRVAAAGITTGCEPRKFCPMETVSRGQMAAFLARALGLI